MEKIECPICFESFDRTIRIPLVLLCGHSICKKCTIELAEYSGLITCPLDRKEDTRPINQISFSFTILELIDHVSAMSAKLTLLALSSEERRKAIKNQVEEKIWNINQNIDKIGITINDIKLIKENILNEIDNAFNTISSAVDTRKEILKNEVHQLTEESLETYYNILENILSLKITAEEKLLNVNELSENTINELAAFDIQEIPKQSLKLKFTEDTDKLLGQLKHYGRIRINPHSIPYGCDHFTNITYWMVSPCCSQYYCCNKCHDKRESHGWTYANRMVCMYCEREQDYRKLPNRCEYCDSIHKGVISKS